MKVEKYFIRIVPLLQKIFKNLNVPSLRELIIKQSMLKIYSPLLNINVILIAYSTHSFGDRIYSEGR